MDPVKTSTLSLKGPLNPELSDDGGIENKVKKLKKNDISIDNQHSITKFFTKITK